MRPRHEASENGHRIRLQAFQAACFNEAEARGLGKPPTAARILAELKASMRPRHEASENHQVGQGLRLGVQASMRPRHEASENCRHDDDDDARRGASMRPRHEASENMLTLLTGAPGAGSFNEAEARGLGKPLPFAASRAACSSLQ